MNQWSLHLRHLQFDVEFHRYFFSLFLAFIPEQNRFLNIVPIQGKEWRISLEVNVHQGSGNEHNEVLRMTSDESMSIGPGTRLPLITVMPNRNEFSVNVQTTQAHTAAYATFQLNQWYKLEVNHYKMGPRRSMIIWHVDEVEKKRIVQEAVPEFTNVKCFTASKFKQSLKGQIRNLKFVQGQEKLRGECIKIKEAESTFQNSKLTNFYWQQFEP